MLDDPFPQHGVRAQMSQVLFHGKPTDGPAPAPVPVSKISARPVPAEELVLDMDRQIARPLACPSVSESKRR
jgi:hypothetical protein